MRFSMTTGSRPTDRTVATLAALTGLVVLGVGIWLFKAPSGQPSPRLAREASEGVAFLDDTECGRCHRNEYDAWTNSHHDLAMQPANPDTVLGDFDDTTFTHFGKTSLFFTRDDEYFVSTEGPDGAAHDYQISYTFGIDPLQQYLVAFPGGRLQSLTIAWNVEQEQWFHLYPNAPIPANDPLHWTGRYQNWNLMCAGCHSTNLRKGYDIKTDTYDTTWAAIDVGCQSCHGPGAAHQIWAQSTTATNLKPADDNGLTEVLSREEPGAEIDTCAPCHSRREQLTSMASPDPTFLDAFLPTRLAEGLYHPDGQILDEVYVYGSFVQSKMHDAGVQCSDCHDPHSLELRAEGNDLCTRCHRDTAVPRFPKLPPGQYDSTNHHRHDATSEGARCVNCHMPARTYMGVDPRRDHSFRVPRPDLSMSLGTPNPCTGCHTDRDDAWAAGVVSGWSNSPPEPHFAELFSAARAGKRTVRTDLATLARDPQQPGIVRATALELLRQFGQAGMDAARAALTDNDPLVRTAAAGGLDALPPSTRRDALHPLLTDRVRAVRLEAARALADVAASNNAADDPALTAAMNEYFEAQAGVTDLPATHVNLGVTYQRRRELPQAEGSYRSAIRLDPWFTPAVFNLATLLNEQRRNEEAEAVLRAGLERTPDDGELHYSLGLILAEENRIEAALTSLSKAAALVPDRARVRYNYGLALQRVNRLDDAETTLNEARVLDPEDPDILLALTRLLMDQRRWEEAQASATDLIRLRPTDPNPQRLLNQIRLRMRQSEP